MTDPNPNTNDAELQRTWTPDPDARGGVPAGDPFDHYFGKSVGDGGPDI